MMVDPAATRVGIFGGTFDPIHYGHLECAQRAKDALDLDNVIFMPCSIPSFKADEDVSSADERLEMCRLACEGNPSFLVSDMEIARGGISYTIDTAEELLATLPIGIRMFFIVGTDSFLTIAEWKDATRLASLVEFSVVSRPGDSALDVQRYAAKHGISFAYIEIPGLDISSTYIRQLISSGESARYLTPDPVLAYIESAGLYRISKNGHDGASHALLDDDSEGRLVCAHPETEPSDIDVFSQAFYDARIADLKDRVSKRRLEHIHGVTDTSRLLARVYGVDEESAYLAGLLHDWDKGLDDEGIRRRLIDLGLQDEVDPFVVEMMPQVLHGPTAARALSRMYPQIPLDVISAIKDHTTCSSHPDDLLKVLYIADAIEPTRTFEGVDSYREKIGKVSLDELFLDIYKFWTLALVKRGKPLHPDTVKIWNALIA